MKLARSASISLPLNFFFLPMGYLYLKDSRRFVLGAVYSFTSTMIFSFIGWLNPRIAPLWLNAPLLFFLSLAVTAGIMIDTYRLTRRQGEQATWPVFSKPHVFWFIPVYYAVMVTGAFITEPWEKPFVKTHNIPSPAMEPNVQVGDFVFADYWIDPEKLNSSDIVIHKGTGQSSGKKLIKRIIGMPGEKIRVFSGITKGPNGRGYEVLRYTINGRLIPVEYATGSEEKYRISYSGPMGTNAVFRETYGDKTYEILEEPFHMTDPDTPQQEITLGPDEFYLLGDNRDHSMDSRHHGPVLRKNIVGKYLHTYFSIWVGNPACEMEPTAVFLYRVITEPRNKPCGTASVRWERAGFAAP